MAYGLRYQSDFYNYFLKAVSVKIYKQDYSDSVEDDFRVSEVVIESNYQNDNTAIIGCGAKIVIEVTSNTFPFIKEMLTAYERQYMCTISYDGTIVFRGYSICDLNERELLPYASVTVQFTDYLHRLEEHYPVCLKEMKSKITVMGLVSELLNKSSLDLPLYVNSTLFENDMTKAATDTFLPQVYVQNAQFYSNSYQYDNIYKAVNESLEPFSAFLFYHKDMWIMERQEDITRTGNWVKYGTDGASSVASLKAEYNKQDGDFKYVDAVQKVEYDSGLHTLILQLKDKLRDSFVFNDFTEDMLTVADDTPDAGSLELYTWYRSVNLTGVSVGTQHREIERYVKYTSTDYLEGLYYNFEIQFNDNSENATRLSINFKMSGDVTLDATIIAIQIHFLLRADGGLFSDFYLYQDENGQTAWTNTSVPWLYTNIDVRYNDDMTWTASVSLDLEDFWAGAGYPTTQRFTIMFLPSVYVDYVNVPHIVSTNYIGDIEVSVNDAQLDNRFEYQLNQNFVKTDEIDLSLFDLPNLNYTNGLLLAGNLTGLGNFTNAWTSENSPSECPLYEIFAKCKFRKYGRTLHRLKGKILADKILKPFAILTDDTIMDDSGDVVTFLLNKFTWDLNAGTYDIEAESYTEEEVQVEGVTYDSSGHTTPPSGDTPSIPTGLAVSIMPVYQRIVEVTWDPLGTGATGFKLQRKPYYANGGWVDSYKMLYVGTHPYFFDNIALEAGLGLTSETMTYKICAYNAAGDSGYSAEVTIDWVAVV